MATPADSYTEMVQVVLPNDANPLGFILGGTVMHLIDIAGAITAARHARVPIVTAAVDDLQFLHPVRVGDLVILRARLGESLNRSEAFLPAAEWGANQENGAGIERQLRELRNGVMRVRLVPVGEIFRRMPFVVRDLVRETACDITYFLLDACVSIQCVVAGGVRLVVTDVAIQYGRAAGLDQLHVGEPVGERAA